MTTCVLCAQAWHTETGGQVARQTQEKAVGEAYREIHKKA